MVKQVSKKTEAAAAGFKAFDVILKVGADTITTSADWDRALRSNQGKPVQVTVLRDKKQQTLTLQVDSKHRSALEFDKDFDNNFDGLFASGDAPLLAELTQGFDTDRLQAMTAQAQAEAGAAAAQARQQADAIRKQIENMRLQMSPEQMSPDQIEQLRQQTEKLRENMKNFQIDPKQIQQLQQQMEQFHKSFNDEQMKQLQQQLQQQIERFKQQMEQWSEQGDGHFV